MHPRQNYPEVVGPPINDVFARVDHDKSLELAAQIKSTGHDIKDIKAVIIGHLHLDHAGGLDPFRNTGIPMCVSSAPPFLPPSPPLSACTLILILVVPATRTSSN